MKILAIIKVALKNIASNKLRSILTMLGLIIGISSVIILVGIGSGSTGQVEASVQSLRNRYINNRYKFNRL
ncbi:MAG: ABC transporter permease [Lachnospiraceae bacterium]|jgi:putative ABC transport system permease protein|nr:ABC transporter permease [Lachnospiraceae bacterium]